MAPLKKYLRERPGRYYELERIKNEGHDSNNWACHITKPNSKKPRTTATLNPIWIWFLHEHEEKISRCIIGNCNAYFKSKSPKKLQEHLNEDHNYVFNLYLIEAKEYIKKRRYDYAFKDEASSSSEDESVLSSDQEVVKVESDELTEIKNEADIPGTSSFVYKPLSNYVKYELKASFLPYESYYERVNWSPPNESSLQSYSQVLDHEQYAESNENNSYDYEPDHESYSPNYDEYAESPELNESDIEVDSDSEMESNQSGDELSSDSETEFNQSGDELSSESEIESWAKQSDDDETLADEDIQSESESDSNLSQNYESEKEVAMRNPINNYANIAFQP